jgi:hypothetical protein
MSTTAAPVYWFDAWVERVSVQLAENIAQQQPGKAKLTKLRLLFSEGSVWPDLYECFWDNASSSTEPHEYRPDPAKFPHRFFIRRSHHQYEQDLSIPHRHHQADPVADLFLSNACAWDKDFYADSWSIWIPGCLPRLLLDMSVMQVEYVLPTALANEGILCKKAWQFEILDSQGKQIQYSQASIITQLKEQLNFYFQTDKVFALACALCFERDENKDWFNQLRQQASETD